MVIIQMFSSAREADLPAMTWRCPFLSLLFVHMFQLPFSLLLCLWIRKRCSAQGGAYPVKLDSGRKLARAQKTHRLLIICNHYV